jgi:CYTH domain-containing protein
VSTTKIEVERRWVIQLPKSWADLAEIFDDLVDIKRISQTYLKPNDKGISSRIRKTIEGLLDNTKTVFHLNQKEFVEGGVHKETEGTISKEKYDQLLKEQHPDKVMLEKTRYVFKYQDQCFELDVFKGGLRGLAILELELNDKTQKVELPPFLRVVKEITSDRRFNNFALANKKLHQ